MDKNKEILIKILAWIGAIFILINLAISLTGKNILKKALSSAFKRPVKVGSFNALLPFSITVNDIEAEGVFKVDKVLARGIMFNILNKSLDIVSLKLVQPQADFEKVDDPAIPSGPSLAMSGENTGSKALKDPSKENTHRAEKVISLPKLSAGMIIIENGIFNFVDVAFDNKKIKITIDDLNLRIRNLSIGRQASGKSYFDLKGNLPWRSGLQKGSIETSGWVDFSKRDMDAKLEVKDIDGVYLYPYYSKWVNLEKARIENANLNFSSDIKGKDNEITAECHLELKDIVFRPRDNGEKEEKAEKIAAAVLDIFSAMNKGNIVLNFTIKTKMNMPKFGFDDINNAVKTRLAENKNKYAVAAGEIFSIPIVFLREAGLGFAGLSKAVVQAAVRTGEDFKKAVSNNFQTKSNL